jgi:hypothetical protein
LPIWKAGRSGHFIAAKRAKGQGKLAQWSALGDLRWETYEGLMYRPPASGEIVVSAMLHGARPGKNRHAEGWSRLRISRTNFIGRMLRGPARGDADKAGEGGHVNEGFDPLHGRKGAPLIPEWPGMSQPWPDLVGGFLLSL